MLVPVGCGLELAPTEMLPADEYERVLHWFDEQSKTCPIDLKATCAPHYYRIRAQRLEDERRDGDFSGSFIAPGTRAKAAPTLLHGGGHGQHLSAMTRGCLAGTAVCFVSNVGEVYPCGYLPVSAGGTRRSRLRGHLEQLGRLQPAARQRHAGREVRRVPLRLALRRLPRACVCGDGELPRRRAVLQLPAGARREEEQAGEPGRSGIG